MRKLLRPALGLLALVAVMSSCQGPADAYIAADRATFDVIAPTYLIYVTNDTGLDQEERERRQRTIASWQARLRAAEAR